MNQITSNPLSVVTKLPTSTFYKVITILMIAKGEINNRNELERLKEYEIGK